MNELCRRNGAALKHAGVGVWQPSRLAVALPLALCYTLSLLLNALFSAHTVQSDAGGERCWSSWHHGRHPPFIHSIGQSRTELTSLVGLPVPLCAYTASGDHCGGWEMLPQCSVVSFTLQRTSASSASEDDFDHVVGQDTGVCGSVQFIAEVSTQVLVLSHNLNAPNLDIHWGGLGFVLQKSITNSFVLLALMWRRLTPHQLTKSAMTLLYSSSFPPMHSHCHMCVNFWMWKVSMLSEVQFVQVFHRTGTFSGLRLRLKMCRTTPQSWTAQSLNSLELMPSGPVDFLIFIFMSSLLTWLADMERLQWGVRCNTRWGKSSDGLREGWKMCRGCSWCPQRPKGGKGDVPEWVRTPQALMGGGRSGRRGSRIKPVGKQIHLICPLVKNGLRFVIKFIMHGNVVFAT